MPFCIWCYFWYGIYISTSIGGCVYRRYRVSWFKFDARGSTLLIVFQKGMKLGIGAGIGLFLAIIGLKNAGVVVDNPATL